MTDSDALPRKPDYKERFLTHLRASLEQQTFVKLVLGKYRGEEPGLTRLLARKLTLKGEECLSFVYGYETREITKNVPLAEGLSLIENLIGNAFKSAHLFSTTEDVQMEYRRRGKCVWSSGKASHSTAPSGLHDKEKGRLIDVNSPFLTALGLTNNKHSVISSMSRKWKQINKFLEIFQQAYGSSSLSEAKAVHVVDFGAGKGYLTFAVHQYLQQALGVEAHVTGVEVREDLVRFCNDTAKQLSLNELFFHQGDVSSYAPGTIDILMALHACDTATDQALYMGIRSGAKIIMSAPCCHKEIRKQITPPDVLKPMLQYGVHLGQEAEMITDSLRALSLETHGYNTQLLEFISLEHTSKNKMLLAVKHDKPVDREALLAQISGIKKFYGITEQCLEKLLTQDEAVVI